MTAPTGFPRRPAPTFLGTPPFPDAARAALADRQLRANLGRATAVIRAKRAAAVAEVEDWEQLRLAGAAIKDQVLANLPRYLEQLEATVTAAGGIVHWARDAAEANDLVADIAQTHQAREVVKVKSMATQEIELNEALAAKGIDVWETDLAELIVQLAGDLPSHILVPAIHRNRAEIRDIFQRTMGQVGRPAPEGLGDDPRELAKAARLHLREKFLRARVAISGGNFAVAETGTIVVVESEGNGRMCLTLPQVLITVLGIEKLVPTWQDLEVFMQLLPRSSTAERMNPYTSTWTGVTPGDGPTEFHLVLLDNGRTDTLADPLGRTALRCIRCSACLNVCPVYERTGGRAYGRVYPGPIGAILTPQLRGINQHPVDAQTASLPYASSLCGACFDACPVRIDIPDLLVHLRAKVVDHKRATRRLPGGEQVAMSGAALVLGGPGRLMTAQRLAGLASRVLGRGGRLRRLPGPGWVGAWFGSRSGGTSARAVPGMVATDLPPRDAPVSRPSPRGPRARDEIMRRAGAALADRPQPGPIPRDYRRTGLPGDVIELFAERAAEYKASVRRIPPDELPAAIAGALGQRGARRIAVPPGLPGNWLSDTDGEVERHSDDPPLTVAQLEQLDGVITGCAVAIAETGTIILDAGFRQGRRVLTLLPDYHLCVVRADQIVATLAEGLARLGPDPTPDLDQRPIGYQ